MARSPDADMVEAAASDTESAPASQTDSDHEAARRAVASATWTTLAHSDSMQSIVSNRAAVERSLIMTLCRNRRFSLNLTLHLVAKAVLTHCAVTMLAALLIDSLLFAKVFYNV